MRAIRILCLLIVLAVALHLTQASGEVPKTTTYQGWLRDSQGHPVNATLSMTFTLYDDSLSGANVWSETHSDVVVDSGAFSVVLGLQNPLEGSIFSGGELWMELDVNREIISPRVRLTSMPYSANAASVEFGPHNIDSGVYNFVAGDSNAIDQGAMCAIPGGYGNRIEILNVADTIPPDTTMTCEPKFVAPSMREDWIHFPSTVGGYMCESTGGASAIVWGWYNETHGPFSFIGCGYNNRVIGAYGMGSYSSILGGHSNKIDVCSRYSAITGGYANYIKNFISFIGTGYGDSTYDRYNTIVSGCNNVAGTNDDLEANSEYAVVVGGAFNTASGYTSAIVNGHYNSVSGMFSYIGGGSRDTIWSDRSVIGGGYGNMIGAGKGDSRSGYFSVIGGGYLNKADGDYAVIAGGQLNTAAGSGNVIGGGRSNNTEGTYSTVAGGSDNAAILDGAAVAGGTQDTASGYWAFVGAGNQNVADGDESVVVGGRSNRATSYGWMSAIGGGRDNVAAGEGATVPGGKQNRAAGLTSMASGYRAKADHDGTFVWADHTDADFTSTGTDQFLIRANGGVGINTASPAAELHVEGDICATGSIGACSDLRYKTDIEAISGSLAKVLQLRGVNYKWRIDEFPEKVFDDETQIGLIAQEVLEIVPEVVQQGKDGYYSVDYGRLAPLLVEAIKELNTESEQKQARIEELSAEIADLREQVETLLSERGR